MHIIEYCCIFVMLKFAFNNTIVYSIVSIAFHNVKTDKLTNVAVNGEILRIYIWQTN